MGRTTVSLTDPELVLLDHKVSDPETQTKIDAAKKRLGAATNYPELTPELAGRQLMVTYKLINPSDPYTFDAADDDIATTLALLLGGMIGWERPDGDQTVSDIPALGASNPERMDELERILGDVMGRRLPDLIAALRSLEINPDGRAASGLTVEQWHDQNRSSMSDYRAEAQRMAAWYETRIEKVGDQ